MPDLLDTYIENRWLVHPNHANSLETAHGGTVMKWMDEAGAMAAMRFAGRTCVTVNMDQISFHRPIQVGEVALVEAYVYAAGRTSVRVHLRVARENPRTGRTEETTASYAVYVAIDEDREPVEVPELTVASEEGERLRDRARSGESG